MTSDCDDELDLFLKYVDLTDCKESLRQAGVYRLVLSITGNQFNSVLFLSSFSLHMDHGNFQGETL